MSTDTQNRIDPPILVPRSDQKTEPPKAACTKVGDSCMFAPGKLGLCVEPVNGGALICQSQH